GGGGASCGWLAACVRWRCSASSFAAGRGSSCSRPAPRRLLGCRLIGAPRRTPSMRFCSASPDVTRMPCAAWPAPCPPLSARVVAFYTYTALICRCCEALWRVGRADFADVLERNLRAKTLAADFREPGADARLAMAQLCALTGRPDEAHEWFERARAVLDEQGARPLRALVDLDEAWMEVRRGPQGDRDHARA